MLNRTKGGPLVVYGLLVLLAASMLFPSTGWRSPR